MSEESTVSILNRQRTTLRFERHAIQADSAVQWELIKQRLVKNIHLLFILALSRS